LSSNESELARDFDRAAVVAIQGGGVYGLSMLGQLSAVLEAGIVPIALSGTSAGAVVAVLIWAGYSPKDIREMFVDLATATSRRSADRGSRETLVDLVGPFGDPPLRYDYHRFHWLAKSISAHLRLFICSADEAAQPSRTGLWWRLGLVRWTEVLAGLTTALVSAAIGVGYWQAGNCATHTVILFVVASWVVIAPVVCRRPMYLIRSLWIIACEILAHPWPQRGFFSGERFETFICQKLRDSPKLAAFRAELDGQPLTFGRVAALSAAHPEDDRVVFVPLILTATDLGKRELVLIASYDERYADLPIAKAVRASAGFPIFFKPIDFASDLLSGCYVDGGVIANYPAWVFSRELRRVLSDTADYREVSTRPWLNIGLRMAGGAGAAGAATTGGFLRAMFDLVRGRVRDQLETALSAQLPRTLTIDQPYDDSGAPHNFLDIHELTRDKIHAMFLLGQEYAAKKLKGIRFSLPRDDDPICESLAQLVQQVNLVLGQKSNDALRL
jgi:predicted acylesterase/phospholipase RssA